MSRISASPSRDDSDCLPGCDGVEIAEDICGEDSGDGHVVRGADNVERERERERLKFREHR